MLRLPRPERRRQDDDRAHDPLRLAPDLGDAHWSPGMPAAIDNRALKKITGVIPQEINLDNDLTVRENLVVFARFFDIGRREAKTRIAELLKFVELEAKADSKIDQLSTGMKRRLLIARALINRPRFIVADEPTTGLDPQARHLIWQRLRQLKSQGDDPDPDDPVHGGGPAALRPHRGHVPGQDPQGRRCRPGSSRRRSAGRSSRSASPPEDDARLLAELGAFACGHERVGDTLYFYCRDGHALMRKLARARPAQHRPPAGDARGRLPEADRTEPHRMNLSYRISLRLLAQPLSPTSASSCRPSSPA